MGQKVAVWLLLRNTWFRIVLENFKCKRIGRQYDNHCQWGKLVFSVSTGSEVSASVSFRAVDLTTKVTKTLFYYENRCDVY